LHLYSHTWREKRQHARLHPPRHTCSHLVGKMDAGDAAVVEKLKAMKEWSRAVVFNEEGHVLGSTFAANEPELKLLLSAFKDYDTTVGGGLTIDGQNYDVHRYYDNQGLIYGRRGEAENGEGIALCKVTGAKSKKAVFGLITFGFPILTARAVPQLRDFMQHNIAGNY